MIQDNKKYTVLLLWYMEGENFGDVMICQTVRTFLENIGICVEEHEVGAPCNQIFEHANRCDFLLFAGGGLIERGIPNVIRYFKEDYPLLKVPYGIMGFGMGAFDYSAFYPQIAFWVQHAEFFYVRDTHTESLLNQIAEVNKAIHSADCVFYNDYFPKTKEDDNDIIGVNVRDLPYPDITGDLDWIQMNEALRICKCNYLIPDSSDEMSKITIPIRNEEIVKKYSEISKEEKVRCIINEIRRCNYIIAMRFHVVLLAAMVGVIPIPIMYCPKVKFLAGQLGIEELALEVEQYELIPQRLNWAKTNHAIIMNRLEARVSDMRTRAKAMFASIRQFFCIRR